MEEKDKEGEKDEKDTPLLQIDPKWYVRHPTAPATHH